MNTTIPSVADSIDAAADFLLIRCDPDHPNNNGRPQLVRVGHMYAAFHDVFRDLGLLPADKHRAVSLAGAELVEYLTERGLLRKVSVLPLWQHLGWWHRDGDPSVVADTMRDAAAWSRRRAAARDSGR